MNTCSHCLGTGYLNREEGKVDCQLCGGLGRWGEDEWFTDHGIIESIAMSCEYCGGTAIDAEVLRRFDMVSPCRHCTLPRSD